MTTTAAPNSAPRQARTSDFKPLVQQIRASGLLDRRVDYYLVTGVALISALALLVAGVYLLSASWLVLLLAPVAALLSAQVSFVGHDAGHQQISSSRGANRIVGTICANVLTGLSYGWWQDKHLRHHASPNHEGLDPDVGEGIISWSEQQQAKKSGFARWFSRHQALFFFPLLTLEGWHLKVSGLRALRARPRSAQFIEAPLLVLHYIGYLGFLFFVLPPLPALAFVLIHQALYGLLLGCAFAPNHKGMEMPEAGSRMDHLRKQVLTSRNITGSPLVDFMLGGLNYQIEHHLFPSIPRPHLKLAQPIIKDHCASLGIPYRECGVIESYGECLAHLRTVGHSTPAA